MKVLVLCVFAVAIAIAGGRATFAEEESVAEQATSSSYMLTIAGMT